MCEVRRRAHLLRKPSARLGCFRFSAICVQGADRVRFRRIRCSPSGRFPGSPISPLLRCRPFGAAPLRRSAPARDSGRSRRRRRSAASAPCGGTQKSVLCRAIFRSARFESRSARRSAAPLTQPVSVGSEIDICPTMTSSPSLLCGPFGPCSPPPSGAPCLRAFGAGGASPPSLFPELVSRRRGKREKSEMQTPGCSRGRRHGAPVLWRPGYSRKARRHLSATKPRERTSVPHGGLLPAWGGGDGKDE